MAYGQKTGGRKKGTPNKSTQEIREAYQRLVEGNLDNMTKWLDTIAKDNPDKAMDMMLKLSEYMIPKLARQEIVGDGGEDLFKNITLNFGEWKDTE
jgi:hypothetical protein